MPAQISSPRDGYRILKNPVDEARSLGASRSPKKGNPRRFASLTLAASATMTSCGIAVFAAWERGGTFAEQLAYCAFAGVVVSGVNLLPMLSRGQSLAARAIVGVVCAAGLVSTLSGQLTFYELAQQHAGERRAESVPDPVTAPLSADPSVRNLTAISRDQAAARTKLAFIDSLRCGGTCAEIRRRRAAVIATLDELQTEAEEARRRERVADRMAALDDRTTRQRDAMRADPAAARLSVLTGIDEDHVALALDLIYASVLDGIGIIGWFFAMQGRSHDNSTERSASGEIGHCMGNCPLETELANGAVDRTVRFDTGSHTDVRFEQLLRDVADGKLKATVAGIRNHLGCAQGTAAKLRRELLTLGVIIDRNSGGRHVR